MAGDYRLSLSVSGPRSQERFGGPGSAIGTANLEVTVPEIPTGGSAEPFDVGVVTATLFKNLEPGDWAPDFIADDLQGGVLRLGRFDGKLVLLHFVSSRVPPSVAQLSVLRQIQEQHADDDRLVLISLSTDQEIDAARQFFESQKLPWKLGFAGPLFAGAGKDYLLRSLPAIFLIAPSGRVLLRNPKDDQLPKAVTEALANESLFHVEPSARPPRFPVTRFDVPAETSPMAAAPALIVLDDADPDFNKEDSHDALHAYSADGQQLWTLDGLHNSQAVGGHRLAIDRQRKRIYVTEMSKRRLVAIDARGNRLWQVDGVEAISVAVHEPTGNIWICGGGGSRQGVVVVFSPEGGEVNAVPISGIDLADDPSTDTFWLVGTEIVKVSTAGDVMFRQRVQGWMAASVSVSPQDRQRLDCGTKAPQRGQLGKPSLAPQRRRLR